MPICLYVHNSPPPGRAHLAKLGGGAVSLLGIFKELANCGWQAQVVVPGEGQFTEAARDAGIPCQVYPFGNLDARRPVASWRIFATWRRIMRSVRPDIIHANAFDLSRSFGPAARSLCLPFVTHVRFPANPAEVRWVLRGLPKPRSFIFNSKAMMGQVWPEIGRYAPASRPFVVHNGADLTSFTPAPWPAAPPYRVGIVANFAEFKRHEDFLRMAARIASRRRDVEFWIVGEDVQGEGRRQTLDRLALDLGIERCVRFVGHRSDVAEIMARLHVLVVTSGFEPFGNVIIEALARGRPVVGSRAGGIPEIIEHERCGYLVETGDCAGFADAVLKLIDDRDRWETMSRRAAEVARARFSNEASVARIAAIYDDAINGWGDRRPCGAGAAADQ